MTYDAVTPAVFGCIKSLVRAAQHAGCIRIAGFQRGDSDRSGYVHVLAGCRDSKSLARHCFSQTLSDLRGDIVRCIGHDDDEFLAAESASEIGAADGPPHPLREILQDVIRLTKAFPVEPTPEEQEEMQLLEEQRVRSLRDSKLSQEVRARQKREQELLQQARGDVASQTA